VLKSAWILAIAIGCGAGCAFNPSTLQPGGADGGTADASGAAADSPLGADAPEGTADAGGPDASTEPCPVTAHELTLGVPVNGALAGASHYEPTCTVGMSTGGEDIYFVDIGAVTNNDLVVNVEDKGQLDSVVDITQGCVGQGASGVCENVAGPGGGEVVVIPSVFAGRRYIAVDSFGSTSGSYTVRAFLRSVVSKGTACSPDLTSSRCGGGGNLYCLDVNNDGTAKCEEEQPIADFGANDTPCAATTVFSKDGAFSGSIDGPEDRDVVALEPPKTTTLRVVVDNGFGGCSVDTQLELLSGDDCSTAVVVASDDNSGLGPCPLLTVPSLAGGKRHWLRISPVAGATVSSGAPYSMVIDFGAQL
jgi:hypothetical protein